MQITNKFLLGVSQNELDLMDLYDELISIQRLDADYPACEHILNSLRKKLCSQIETPL